VTLISVRSIFAPNNVKTIIVLEVTFVLFELQKMSETNQDSTSKAPNMQIQHMMVPAPLSNSKPEKPEKFDGTEFKR